jgi:ubiquinone/menaquinone biosynthesis C-methylase UbiE
LLPAAMVGQVTGIDLTPEYVETAKVVCGWVGLDSRISLHQGSALAMPFADRVFDRAYMLHVGMNIDEKARLCSEVSRVLRPNSLFGIYDVMRTGDGELTSPVPWATTSASSAVAKPTQYREALERAGFKSCVFVAEAFQFGFHLIVGHGYFPDLVSCRILKSTISPWEFCLAVRHSN